MQLLGRSVSLVASVFLSWLCFRHRKPIECGRPARFVSLSASVFLFWLCCTYWKPEERGDSADLCSFLFLFFSFGPVVVIGSLYNTDTQPGPCLFLLYSSRAFSGFCYGCRKAIESGHLARCLSGPSYPVCFCLGSIVGVGSSIVGIRSL